MLYPEAKGNIYELFFYYWCQFQRYFLSLESGSFVVIHRFNRVMQEDGMLWETSNVISSGTRKPFILYGILLFGQFMISLPFECKRVESINIPLVGELLFFFFFVFFDLACDTFYWHLLEWRFNAMGNSVDCINVRLLNDVQCIACGNNRFYRPCDAISAAAIFISCEMCSVSVHV